MDPGDPAYEAARIRLADRLREVGRGSYVEMADDLLAGDLMQVPTWVVLDMLAEGAMLEPLGKRG